MRLIDAEAFEANMQNEWERNEISNGEWIHFREMINAEPTIKPQQRWIPCSERLPEERDAGILKKLGTSKRSDYVLITVDVKGERMASVGCTHDGIWNWDKKYAFPNYKVIAWMPLPEAYQEEGEER